MGFAREEKMFLDFCRRFGGKCRVLRREWELDGERQREVFKAVGESICLLTKFEKTLPDIDPAAVNRSRAKIYLPGTADIRTGDCLEVRWGKKAHQFVVSGQPQDYVVYTMAEIRKEEWA